MRNCDGAEEKAWASQHWVAGITVEGWAGEGMGCGGSKRENYPLGSPVNLFMPMVTRLTVPHDLKNSLSSSLVVV